MLNLVKNNIWSVSIDNGDETISLSEKTSWRMKGRYIPGVLDVEFSSQVELGNFDEGTSKSIFKETSRLSDLKGKYMINDQEVKVKKNKKEVDQARRPRYKKNLVERKNFWK